MKLNLERNGMLIVPENEMEKAYLENVLDLKEDWDEAQAIRMNVIGSDRWAYLEICKKGMRRRLEGEINVNGRNETKISKIVK